MALIDVSAEIKGTSNAGAAPIRVMEVTAALSGRSAGNLQRQQPVKTQEKKPSE